MQKVDECQRSVASVLCSLKGNGVYIVQASPYYSTAISAKQQVQAAYHQLTLPTGCSIDDFTVVLNGHLWMCRALHQMDASLSFTSYSQGQGQCQDQSQGWDAHAGVWDGKNTRTATDGKNSYGMHVLYTHPKGISPTLCEDEPRRVICFTADHRNLPHASIWRAFSVTGRVSSLHTHAATEKISAITLIIIIIIIFFNDKLTIATHYKIKDKYKINNVGLAIESFNAYKNQHKSL